MSIRKQYGIKRDLMCLGNVVEEESSHDLGLGRRGCEDWLEFLWDMVRGLPVPTVTSCGAPGLIKAIEAVFLKASEEDAGFTG